ncbi:phosphate ABC transporter substrate-binding/OmpA family protein [Chachezhania sediminis]|uniref:phosphate ABC transporter substrate-binding/OmpA family protein n=1 Tax=Chachezhania sediminis TaxID=2599291 RepID=UPI00131EA178|nr:phosphate ABC transporter substrate-binding/OmpA family protein [Chachezhania sediminis]
MFFPRAARLAALLGALTIPATSALAQDVTLTSRDGAVELSGTLLGFDGEFYRLDTMFGELTVDGSGVTCDGPGCPSLTGFVARIGFSGAASMADVLLPALIEGFALRNGYDTDRTQGESADFTYALSTPDPKTPVATFSFRVTNSDEGFADLLADEADIVMSTREIRPTERTLAHDAGMGDMTQANRSRVLALDAMVPVVSPENPVRAISVPALAQVFAGQIANWQDLGGPDAPIVLHLPEAQSGFAQAVTDRLLVPADLPLAADIRRHPDSRTLSRAVSLDPFAIGLASFADVGAARALMLTGACGYGIAATRRSVKTEDYPLTAPLFLYIPARRLPQVARQFLAYTTSAAAQLVIRRAGFVDLAAERIPVGDQGTRLANAIRSAGPEVSLRELQKMVQVLAPLSRLTTTFRFEAGSARPDAQSRSNILQLAHALEAGTYDAHRLVFAGFSDGEGAAEPNRAISLGRAQAVRDAVVAMAEASGLQQVELEVAGFGEALPMACDDSEWGRQVNRRVEIWID